MSISTSIIFTFSGHWGAHARHRRRPDESTVIGLGVLGNWVLRSTTHLALQSTILSFLYLEDSPNRCLQEFGQTCAGFYIVTLRFRIVDTPSVASERDFDFHIEDSD